MTEIAVIYVFPLLILLLIGFSTHSNAHTVCFEMNIHRHCIFHSRGQWEMNRVSPFPLISAFHYAGADTGGYFTKHSLSPVFFYEMEIITVGEKPSIRHCRSQSNYVLGYIHCYRTGWKSHQHSWAAAYLWLFTCKQFPNSVWSAS